MINEKLYNRTVDILFNAYFNDTLEHGHKCACAVGNLVAANNNCISRFTGRTAFTGQNRTIRIFEIVDKNGYHTNLGQWIKVGYGNRILNQFDFDGGKEIASTGYCLNDIIKIEYAFEDADKGNCEEDWMFNGLVAVLNVLKEIHHVADDNQLGRFKKHYETLRSC